MKVITSCLLIILTVFSLNASAQSIEIDINGNPIEEGGQVMTIKSFAADKSLANQIDVPVYTGKRIGPFDYSALAFDGVILGMSKHLTISKIPNTKLQDVFYLGHQGDEMERDGLIIRSANLNLMKTEIDFQGQKRTVLREICGITPLSCYKGHIIMQPDDASMLREMIKGVGLENVKVKIIKKAN